MRYGRPARSFLEFSISNLFPVSYLPAIPLISRSWHGWCVISRQHLNARINARISCRKGVRNVRTVHIAVYRWNDRDGCRGRFASTALYGQGSVLHLISSQPPLAATKQFEKLHLQLPTA